MVSMLTLKLKVFEKKYNKSTLIIGRDFNDVPDNNLDGWPSRTTVSTGFKPTSHLSDHILGDL